MKRAEQTRSFMRLLCSALLVCAVSMVSPVLLAEEIYSNPEAPLVAVVLETDIHTTDPEEMKYVILNRLLDSYATERGIEVSQADVDAYIDAMARVAEQDRQRRAAQREKLVRRLDKTPPDDTGREALSSQIDTLDQLQNSLNDMDSGSGEDHAAREQVATAFIQQWKLNRDLYRQYGGRIIYQQGGPEPLDAWRQFLEDQEKQGSFRILDKSLESEFWRYYTTDSIHSFYPAGSQEEAQAFEIPWWLLENPPQ